jgi:mannosyl-glycoprotein endo-beta-N-acetylglucosaminidase
LNQALRLVALVLFLIPIASFAASTSLVNHGEAQWRYRKGTNAPQADWKTATDAALDATWLGPVAGGIGYSDGDDATVLTDMQNNYTTLYTRRTFNVTNALDHYASIQLTVDWDDGFVAWLDGVEIARSDEAPGSVGAEPAYNALASDPHSAAIEGGAVVTFDAGLVGGRLAPGPHVLAVMGLNNDIASTDLTLKVDLAAKDPLPPLIPAGTTWRYFKGLSAPATNWQTMPDASLDAAWLSGPGGFGYADGDDATQLNDMRNGYSTIFIRKTFAVDTAAGPRFNLQLIMDWDDGFVAYLDGKELARDRAPGIAGGTIFHTNLATSDHEASATSANPPVAYNLGNAATLLTPGTHVLALVGLNTTLDSSDLTLIPTLLLAEAPAATRPTVPAWSIAQLLAWNPLTDPDAPYNIGTVPLRDRFNVPMALQANPNARIGQGGIQSLDILNGSTSGNPPQGDTGSRYTFTYWQYVKEMVYWGGSASEGIFVPPAGDTIDAAHRNGVPILGTIFWPPTVYGGNYQWVQDFLAKRPDGSFPAADKLIQTAEYFGFDGWFFNQETAGGNATDAAAMRDLIKYVRDHSNIRITWYDSMTESGAIAWQDQFDSANDWYMRYPENAAGALIGHSIFLDFVVSASTAASSRTRALNLALNPYDVYAGFELEEGNFKDATGSRQNISTVFPAGANHIVSAGLYKPGRFASSIADQNLMWSGANGDPRVTTNVVGTGNWHGMAHHIEAQSPVNDLPFVTSFCLGQGTGFYVNGTKVSSAAWWNRALQDVLPTWRWIIDSPGVKLTPELYLSDGYSGGGCLRLSGNLNATNTMRLFLTDLPVQNDTRIKVVYKRGVTGVDSQVQVGIALASNPTNFIYFNAGPCTNAGWNVAHIPVGAYAGQRIAALGLRFISSPVVASYDLRVGQLGVYNTSAPPAYAAANVRVLNTAPASAGKINARVRWDHAPGERYYYNVYDRQPNGSLVYLGSTPNNYYFVRNVTERAGEPPADIVVVNVGPDMTQSTLSVEAPVVLTARLDAGQVALTWPGTAGGYSLQSRTDLTSGTWTTVASTITQSNGVNTTRLPSTNNSSFFRLTK